MGRTIYPSTLENIGNVAQEYIIDKPVYFQFVPQMDWSAGDYGDDGSCFWSFHGDAREYINDNSEFGAVIFFTDPDDIVNSGYARAIIFRPYYSDWFMIFNGYGMQTSNITAAIASFLGCQHKFRHSFHFDEDPGSTLYVNNGGRVSVLWKEGEYQSRRFPSNWETELRESPMCSHCGDEVVDYDGEICWRCDEYTFVCADCGDRESYDDSVVVDGEQYCNYCARRQNYVECNGCSENVTTWTTANDTDRNYCNYCAERHIHTCEECGEHVENETNGNCASCAERIAEEERDEADRDSADGEYAGVG